MRVSQMNWWLLWVSRGTVAGHGDFGHAHGKEDAGLVSADGGLEALGRNADDGEGMTVDADSLTDDVRVSWRSGISNRRS